MNPVERFTLVIPGAPVGQGRPRIGRARNGRPIAFTDHKTRSYAQIVQGEWIAAGRPRLIPGGWTLMVTVLHERSAGHYRVDGRTLSAAGARAPWPGKPDLDNVIKAIADSLVAVGAVPDDRHLVCLEARKRWAEPGDLVGVVVDVESEPLPDYARARNEGPAAVGAPGQATPTKEA